MIDGRYVDRWFRCPYSGRFDISETSLAEKVAIAVVKGHELPVGADDEMVECANLFRDEVNDRLADHTIIWQAVGCRFRTQQDVVISPTVVTLTDDNRLWVFQYEYGHRFVDHFESRKMVVGAYAAAIYLDRVEDIAVKMVTVQPRCYQYDMSRSWLAPIEEIQKRYMDIAIAAEIAKDSQERCAASHCGKCPEMLSCSANTMAVQNAIEVTFSEYLESDQERIALEYDVLKEAETMLKNRIAALETRVEHENGNIPGFSMGRTRGSTSWVDPAEAIKVAAELGVDITKPATITPKQAIDAGVPAEIVREHSVCKTKPKIERVTARHMREMLGE